MNQTIPQTPSDIASQLSSEEKHILTVRRSQLVNAPWVLLAVYLCWLVVPVILLIAKVLQIQCNSYTLTTARFIERDGVLNQREEQLELYNIKDITRTASWFQRMVGCGDIRLQTADPTNPEVVIRWVYDAGELTESIRHHMNENKRDLRHVQNPFPS